MTTSPPADAGDLRLVLSWLAASEASGWIATNSADALIAALAGLFQSDVSVLDAGHMPAEEPYIHRCLIEAVARLARLPGELPSLLRVFKAHDRMSELRRAEVLTGVLNVARNTNDAAVKASAREIVAAATRWGNWLTWPQTGGHDMRLAPLEGWLKEHHLTWNPFATDRIEWESQFQKYEVLSPGNLDEWRVPGQRVFVGAEGAGRTAAARWLARELAKQSDQPGTSAILPIYCPLTLHGSESPADILGQLAHSFNNWLLQLLSNQPAAITLLPPPAQAGLAALLLAHTGSLGDLLGEIFLYCRPALQSYWDLCATLSSLHPLRIRDKDKLEEWEWIHLLERASPARLNLNTLEVERCAVYFLVDVQRPAMSGPVDVTCLTQLVPALASAGLTVKLFLPDGQVSQLPSEEFLPRTELHWTSAELKTLLNRRIQWASGNTSYDGLSELCDPSARIQIDRSLSALPGVASGQGTPREALQWARRCLLRANQRGNDSKISPDDMV